MRLTRSRLVALVAFAWLLTSLAATAAVSRDRFDSGSPGEGTPAAATPPPQASARAAAQGDWMAKYRPDCSAPWVVASDPFAFFTGAYGEFVVTVAVAILPALSCGLEGGA